MTAFTDPQSLRDELAQFTCTERYFRMSPLHKLCLTDGSKYLFDRVGGYWLGDILGTEGWDLIRQHDEYLVFVRLTVQGSRAKLEILHDTNPDEVLWSRDIAFTDWPEGQWNLYMGATETDSGSAFPVLYLPSEH